MRTVLYRWRWALLLGGALLTGLCVILPQIGILEWVALIPAAAAILTVTADPTVSYRRLYGMGVAFFQAYYMVNFHWFLYMYPMDFAGLGKAESLLVVCVAWMGLSAFQAVGAALVFPLMGLTVRGGFLAHRPILHPAVLTAFWVSLEWWQANSGWSGVPWARLPLGQAELLPTLQSASLLGSYFVTALIVAVNGYLAYILLHPDRRLFCGLLAGGLFGGNLLFGGLYMATLPAAEDTLRVAAIQGNLSSHDKWGPDSMSVTQTVYADYTRKAVAKGAELIVWPETAIPATVWEGGSVREYLCELSEECGVPILAGVFYPEEGTDRVYNSIVVALPDGRIHDTVYHKRNPVPFGEFVPWRNLVMTLIPPLGEIGMLEDDLLVGNDSTVFDLDGGRVGSMICFDSIYERNALESVRGGAELLAVSTNDSWFKDSRGVWMHNAQSQLRAIETGRWVVRSANTGVSSAITPTGEVVDFLGALREGYVLSEVGLSRRTTVYTVVGNAFAYLSAALCGIGVAIPAVARCRQKWANRSKNK